MNRFKIVLTRILWGILISCGPHGAEAATTVAVASGGPAARPASAADFETWFFRAPNVLDRIRWRSGGNLTDGVLWPVHWFPWAPPGPAEPKFALGPPIAGRPFLGFSRVDVNPPGSKAETWGEGGSRVGRSINGRPTYIAEWIVGADGIFGTVPNASWQSVSSAFDPYSITTAQLAAAGATAEPTYDLFFTAALEGGDYSARGGLGLDVSYEDASGTTALLSISINGTGVIVTNDDPSGLTLYLLAALDEGPTEIQENITTLGSIQAMLEADVASDRSIDTPVYLGLVWDDIPVPTIDLGDGSVAKIRIESEAHDADGAEPGSVPSVSEWGLMVLTLLVLTAGTVVLGRRRRPAAA